MLVYKIEPHSSYTGGCALIAAHNITEAIQFFCEQDDYNDYVYDTYNCTCSLLKDLTYDKEEVKVILNTIYME